ncbi:MAG: hypothetical protein E4H31_00820 [Dehalococcoidia bacterium]|nr:MAG: hypothetical protein E4H31_00820 [Dehalococcoidia bacterium]
MNTAEKGHNIITCTKCHASIDTAVTGGSVKFCPACGTKLFTPSHQTKTNYCPSCGKALSAPFDYCPGCGVQLNGPGAPPHSEFSEDYPPTAAEIASAKKSFVPVSQEQSGELKQTITDPKLKKLYKQWAAYSDLPEEAMPVMERPRPVHSPHRPSAFPLSVFLTSIQPTYLFIAGAILIALILILAIAIAL